MAAEKRLWALSTNATGEVCVMNDSCLLVLVVCLQGAVEQSPDSRCPWSLWSPVRMETLQSSCPLPGSISLRNSGSSVRVSQWASSPYPSFLEASVFAPRSAHCQPTAERLPQASLACHSNPLVWAAEFLWQSASQSQPERCLLIKPLQIPCVAFKPSWTSQCQG